MLQSQQAQKAVRPSEQLKVEPVTFSWQELLELQASLPDNAFAGEELPATAIEVPVVDLPAPGKHAKPAEPESGRESISSCTGFAVEPPVGAAFDSQADVPDGGGFSYIPPNVAGGVGPDHLMTMLTNKVLIQDRLGGTVSNVDTLTFWSPLGATSPVFCRVNYDALAGRWIATARGGTGGAMVVMLAVSQTIDPTGTWDFYSITADAGGTTFPDWLLQGYNATWVAMTANMFNVVGGAFVGSKMWVVDRSTIGGVLTVSVFPAGFMTTTHGSGGSSPHPSRDLDGSDPNMYLLNDSFTSSAIWLLQITKISGTGAAPVVSGLPGSPFGGTTSFCWTTTGWSSTQRTLAQVGDTRFISAFSVRISSVAVRNGKIWSTNSGGLPGPATNASPTSNGLVWRQIDPALPFPPTSGSPGSMLVQDGAITDGLNTMAAYPSIAVNCAEDVLIGFSRSDATKNPEAAYCMRLGTDALNFMGPTSTLRVGDSSYWKNFGVGTTAQWGLYTSTAVDPNDDQTLWTLQEYAALRVGAADNDSRWGTWWGRLGDCEIRPTITDDPDSLAVCVGDPATFTVAATTGSNPLTYQWRLDGVDISGATSDSYTIPSTIAADGGVYDVVVTGCGSKTSLGATLSFTGATVTTDPADYVAAVGDPAGFFITATGQGTLTYQWLRDGVPIPGETLDIYILQSVAATDYGAEFSCIATDDCGPGLSAGGLLLPLTNNSKVLPGELSLHIFEHPESTIGCLGGTATFSVTAFPSGVTYLWRHNGVPIAPPQTNSTLVINPVTSGDGGVYDVQVSLGNQTKTSVPASLTLSDLPVITSQPSPSSQTVSPGSTVIYTVGATGLNLQYQWKKKPDVPFAPYVDLTGSTLPTLVLEDITSADAGTYRCRISNDCGQVQTIQLRLFVF